MIQFGFFFVVFIEIIEYNFVIDFLDNDFFFLERLIIVVLFVIKEINIIFGEFGGLCSVFCLNDDNIWICGQDNIM